MKKNILFIGAYPHLSHPQYQILVPRLRDKYCIYLNVKDPLTFTYRDKLENYRKRMQYFDKYITVSEYPIDRYDNRNRYLTFFTNIGKYKNYKEELNQLLSDINPDLIISTSDSSFSDRTAIKWAKDNYVPFLVIQPAFLGGFKNNPKGVVEKVKFFVFNSLLGLPVVRKAENFGYEDEYTHLILWSKHFKPELSKKNLHYTGNIQLDPLLRKKVDASKIAKDVIIFTQDVEKTWSMEREKEIFQIYAKTFQSLNNFTFTIKIHPREDPSKYRNHFGDYSNVDILETGDVIELIERHHIQASIASYTTIQAAALRKPVISIIPPDLSIKNKSVLGIGIGEVVSNAEGLISAIRYYLESESLDKYQQAVNQFFSKYYYSADGRSTERTLKIIDNLLDTSN